MSPHKRKKLSIIRSELDKLDNTLIKVIKKRTVLVNKVLALKDKKNQIVDQRRINLILKNIKKKSIQNLTKPIFWFKTTILTLLKLPKHIKTDRKSIVDSDGLSIKSESLPGCPIMAGQGA